MATRSRLAAIGQNPIAGNALVNRGTPPELPELRISEITFAGSDVMRSLVESLLSSLIASDAIPKKSRRRIED